MKIKGLDHIVITVANTQKTRDFYEGALGMTYEEEDGKAAVLFGIQKINLHKYPGQFQPAAKVPTEGSGDICLEIDCVIEEACAEMAKHHVEIELGPVSRTGARGEMMSIYMRDPDGNLVELCSYK